MAAQPKIPLRHCEITLSTPDWQITLGPNHVYQVIDRRIGKSPPGPITSVTRVLHHQFPKFDSQKALSVMSNEKRKTRYDGMTDPDIAIYWRKYGKHRATVGKMSHDVHERLMNELHAADQWDLGIVNRIAPTIPPPVSLHIRPTWNAVLADLGVVAEPRLLARVFDHLVDAGLVPIAAEFPLYDAVGRVAGMCDVVLVHQSVFDTWDPNSTTPIDAYVYDWKTRDVFTMVNRFDLGIDGSPAAGQDNSHYTQAFFQLNYYADLIEDIAVINGVRRVRVVGLRIVSAKAGMPDILINEIERDREIIPQLRSFRLAHPEIDIIDHDDDDDDDED